MLSKEEFKKELVRMWDTLREKHKGVHGCEGIESCKECPLHKCCLNKLDDDQVYNAMEIIEIVEKWSKEHPIVTNRDKFKEVFGINLYDTTHECVGLTCPSNAFSTLPTDCRTCPHNGYWSKEYKEPKESK